MKYKYSKIMIVFTLINKNIKFNVLEVLYVYIFLMKIQFFKIIFFNLFLNLFIVICLYLNSRN
jgi:hypothetical protein